MSLKHHSRRAHGYSFYLKRPNSDRPTAIYFRTTFAQIPFKYGIGRSIYPELWNKEIHGPTKDKKLIRSYEKLEPHISIELENIRVRIQNVEREVKLYLAEVESERSSIDLTMLKERLDRSIKKVIISDEVKHTPHFLPYLKDLIIDMEKGVEKHVNAKGDKRRYKDSTIQNYRNLRTQWSKFEKHSSKKYRMKNIDHKAYNSLREFFSSQRLSLNTEGKYIRYLKSTLSKAYNQGLHENKSYESFKAPNVMADSIALNENDLKRLESISLKDQPHYQKALDIFLIGCYTAQRVSDYSRINPEHVKELTVGQSQVPVIEMITKKTGKVVKVPRHPKVERILKKYDYKIPSISDQKLNQYIKEIAKEAGISEIVTIRVRRGGQDIINHVPKYSQITSHTARRTAATLMYYSGIPAQFIMKLTNHSTEKTFMRYLKITDDEAAAKMSKMNFFSDAPTLKVI